MAQTARKLRCIIIDDEEPAVKNLSLILDTYCNNIEVAGTAHSAREGVGLINREKPDMVFLDIEMPNNNGFTLLDELGELNFKLVFVTAYSEYAIQAIKARASDYLLKPIEIEEVVKTVERLSLEIHRANAPDKALKMDSRPVKGKLALPDKTGVSYQEIKDIIWLEADGVYTKLGVASGRDLLISKHLKEFEKMLETYGFLRCHRSYMVNIDHIKALELNQGADLVMSGGKKVPVARRNLQEVKDRLKDLYLSW